MNQKTILTISLSLFLGQLIGQPSDSVTLKTERVQSKELLEFFRFENIDYFKMKVLGEDIKDQYFLLTSDEYWDKKLVKSDTLIDTKKIGFKNGKDTLAINIMSKKTAPDTVKFQFIFPGFSVTQKFRATVRDDYSLRNITCNGRQQSFLRDKSFNLLVYSLPYQDPKKPGSSFYCELTREGTPPEEWGDVFGVEHYIVFKFRLVE